MQKFLDKVKTDNCGTVLESKKYFSLWFQNWRKKAKKKTFPKLKNAKYIQKNNSTCNVTMLTLTLSF